MKVMIGIWFLLVSLWMWLVMSDDWIGELFGEFSLIVIVVGLL